MIIQIREGLHYNPYFPGGAIAMPKMLNDEAVEYEDGVPATEAQVSFPSFKIIDTRMFGLVFSQCHGFNFTFFVNCGADG